MFLVHDRVVRIEQEQRKIYKVQEVYVGGKEVLYLVVRHSSPTKPHGYYAKASEIKLIDNLIDEWHLSDSDQSLIEFLKVEEKDFHDNYLKYNTERYNEFHGFIK